MGSIRSDCSRMQYIGTHALRTYSYTTGRLRPYRASAWLSTREELPSAAAAVPSIYSCVTSALVLRVRTTVNSACRAKSLEDESDADRTNKAGIAPLVLTPLEPQFCFGDKILEI